METTLPFSFLPPFSIGATQKGKEQILPFKSRTCFGRGFIIQVSKQEVQDVVSLCKTGEKTRRCAHSHEGVSIFKITMVVMVVYLKWI